MTFSVLMYMLMAATCVALAGVLVFDAATTMVRWSAQRRVSAAGRAHRPSATSGTSRPRTAATRT